MAVKVKKKTGRPTKYSNRVADYICAEMSKGRSLSRICQDDNNMPDISTVFRWLADDRHKKFCDNYTRAQDERVEVRVEEAFDIAEDGSNDWMEKTYGNDKESTWVLNGESVQRSKLRIDTIKWYAGQMKPKKYGSKIDVTSDGKALPTPITALGIKDAQTE